MAAAIYTYAALLAQVERTDQSEFRNYDVIRFRVRVRLGYQNSIGPFLLPDPSTQLATARARDLVLYACVEVEGPAHSSGIEDAFNSLPTVTMA